MCSTRPRYSKEEFASRGDEIFEEFIQSAVTKEDAGKFVAIDIESGAYEIDADELKASDRLKARVSDPQIWLRRIGSQYVRRFGPRPRSEQT